MYHSCGTYVYVYAMRVFSKAPTIHDRDVTAVCSATSCGVRAKGESSPENRVSARVFARSNPRRINQPGETSLLSSSRRCWCSLHPILFPLSRDNARKIARCLQKTLSFGKYLVSSHTQMQREMQIHNEFDNIYKIIQMHVYEQELKIFVCVPAHI